MPACSQPAVPGRSLFFPSPWIWEAACCLDFPSNPSLPFPISTLHLQRPALLTKWGNRIKWKASCVSRSRHVVENYWPVCDFKIYLTTLSLERITLIKDIHPRTLLMISNIFSLTEHHGDWYNFSRFKGPFSNASHHGVGLLDEVSHCEQLSAIKFTSARRRGGTETRSYRKDILTCAEFRKPEVWVWKQPPQRWTLNFPMRFHYCRLCKNTK